jgi:hypothetical protein
MLAVKFSFHFCQLFVAEVRKANDGTDQAKEDGELRVHSFRLLTEQLKKRRAAQVPDGYGENRQGLRITNDN